MNLPYASKTPLRNPPVAIPLSHGDLAPIVTLTCHTPEQQAVVDHMKDKLQWALTKTQETLLAADIPPYTSSAENKEALVAGFNKTVGPMWQRLEEELQEQGVLPPHHIPEALTAVRDGVEQIALNFAYAYRNERMTGTYASQLLSEALQDLLGSLSLAR